MAEISQKAEAENKKARVVVIGAVSKSAINKGDIVESEDEKEQAQEEFDVEQTASSLLVKGRMLAQTDHTKVYYRPFRKEVLILFFQSFLSLLVDERIFKHFYF
ncbi:unnamed protein product [Meloidogyne enterolobii]|uniref:Uncharacterized protein n=1 Tax=Meloidogyne enterolobii TaxID=390850 RepID=A0ACB1A7I3_MELEN